MGKSRGCRELNVGRGLLALMYHSNAIAVADLQYRHLIDSMQEFFLYLGSLGLLQFEQRPINLVAGLEVAQTKALQFAVEWAEQIARRIHGRALRC